MGVHRRCVGAYLVYKENAMTTSRALEIVHEIAVQHATSVEQIQACSIVEDFIVNHCDDVFDIEIGSIYDY